MQLEKGASQNNFWKKMSWSGIQLQKKSRNNSYTSRTRYQNPNTHSNAKLQQRHPKVPKDPD